MPENPNPKWAVQAPDGKVIQFPDNFTDVDVNREMSKMYPMKSPTGDVIQAAPKPFTLPWLKQKFYGGADIGTKALPAAGATVGGLVGTAGGPAGTIGGAALGGAGGEAASQLVRRALGFESPETSLEAAKQIGIEGAVQGGLQAVTEGGSTLLRAAAPRMAESALKVTERMRGRGRTIGKTLLRETRGIRPETVAKQAGGRLEQLTSQMESAVADATARGATGSTQPAHQVLNDAIHNTPRNAKDLLGKLQSLRDTLRLETVGGGRAPRMIHTPDELLEIKRGIGKTIDTWPPEWQRLGDVKRIQQRLYRALDSELDRLVPGNAEINQTISSLIPAKSQAQRISDQAGFSERVLGRTRAHTGALVSSAAGATLGYREHGAPGAIVGGTLGAVIPEVLASPTAQMAGARAAYSFPKTVPYVLPFVRYGASRLVSKGKKKGENENREP